MGASAFQNISSPGNSSFLFSELKYIPLDCAHAIVSEQCHTAPTEPLRSGLILQDLRLRTTPLGNPQECDWLTEVNGSVRQFVGFGLVDYACGKHSIALGD